MNKTRKVKVSDTFMKMIQERGVKFDSVGKDSYFIDKENENEILKIFGFSKEDCVEIDDFFQFSKHFGFDKEKYLLLKPIKDKAEVTWREIKNIKYGDIDFQNGTISFQNQKVKSNKRREVGR